jgi:hypothetical protein
MTDKQEFMVSVEGRSAPSKIHPNCPEAMVEAERLAERNRGAVIRVLQVVRTLEPRHLWRDFPGNPF